MRVALFVPCFVDALAPEVGMATAHVLERLGHDVVYPADQTCCGQPALNTGYFDEAGRLARRLLDVLARTEPDAVVAPSGSCVAALRVQGPERMGLDRGILDTVFELSEFLTDRLGVTDVGATYRGRVTWHDACHPLRELGIRDGPRRLLRSVRGLELVEADPSDECCGFGGAFSVKMPELSSHIGTRKVEAIEATGANAVASTESSCLLQIRGLLERRGSPIEAVHLAQILGGRP